MESKLPKRKIIRLKNYDYSSDGIYFITICANKRQKIFGNIDFQNQPSVILSKLGEKIDKTLKNISEIEKYIIMPNHIHFTLVLINSQNSVPKIVRKLKSDVSRGVNFPVWQRGYYDRIVRDEREYLNVCEYIENNPYNWDKDEYFY
ncbi:MAG: transposase [Peptoniphilus sp.]|uniref:transposase n=1 Tax=Peptoniphilus sp. TaxID=1971214 RepID=UPI002A761C1F|nr:transposase [Peptoniphilus sp.]MDY2985997.1 transposase [Peptoniphilus sp.]